MVGLEVSGGEALSRAVELEVSGGEALPWVAGLEVSGGEALSRVAGLEVSGGEALPWVVGLEVGGGEAAAPLAAGLRELAGGAAGPARKVVEVPSPGVPAITEAISIPARQAQGHAAHGGIAY